MFWHWNSHFNCILLLCSLNTEIIGWDPDENLSEQKKFHPWSLIFLPPSCSWSNNASPQLCFCEAGSPRNSILGFSELQQEGEDKKMALCKDAVD